MREGQEDLVDRLAEPDGPGEDPGRLRGAPPPLGGEPPRPRLLQRARLDGAVLFAVWACLWTFLALGVGGPLGRLDDQLSRRAAPADRG